jgi:nitrate reductase assembly molybdenum cofactor insertion protein NarJ
MIEDSRRFLEEAAEWRLLALLFEYPAGDWRRQVEAVAAEIADPLLREAATAALEQAAEGIHHSIFGPGGPVPPREASYLTGVQLGYLLAELSDLYQKFGYQPPPAESPDHISVQAGFLAFLKFKLAFETASGNGEHVSRCQEGIDYLLKEHLCQLAEPVAAALESAGPPYLVLAGRALLERVGPAGPRPDLAIPGFIPGDEETEITCGDASPAADSLIQLPTGGGPHVR